MSDYGRDPFNQNFRKFRSIPQWIGSVQPQKFRKNGSTFWGGPLFPVGPVGILGRDPFNQNSDREKWSTSKGGPVFSKLLRLDRTDPLSFGPKFPEILVEWIAPLVEWIAPYDSFVVVPGDEQFQAFLLLSVFGFYYFYFILLYFSIIGFYRQSARYKCWKDKQRCLSACFNPILSKSHSQPKVLLKIVILAERKFWICLFYLVDVLHCGGGKMVSQLFHFHWCSYFAKTARFWDESGCFE